MFQIFNDVPNKVGEGGGGRGNIRPGVKIISHVRYSKKSVEKHPLPKQSAASLRRTSYPGSLPTSSASNIKTFHYSHTDSCVKF